MSPRAARRSATACVRRYLRRSTSEWFIDGGKLRETLYFRNLFLFSLARLSDLVYDLRRAISSMRVFQLRLISDHKFPGI